jgi:predicted acetyltransferase
MEIRYLKGQEILQTRKLYEMVFQDSQAYTDFFYQKAVRECTAVAAFTENCVAGELFLVPKKLLYGGNVIESFYIYGVATAPAYRGQGIMRTLMGKAENYAAAQGVKLLYLIPVKEEIYEGLGYHTIKKTENRIWERSDMVQYGHNSTVEKLTMEKLAPDNFTESHYQEIKEFEQQLLHPGELHPVRDENYFRERIRRASLEGGACYIFRRGERDKITALFLTEEGKDVKLIDALVQPKDKAHAIQYFLQERKIQCLFEVIFPVMIKNIGEKNGMWNSNRVKTALNDEI